MFIFASEVFYGNAVFQICFLKSWQYICDMILEKLVVFNLKYNFCTAVRRKKIFTHMLRTCPSHLNSVLGVIVGTGPTD